MSKYFDYYVSEEGEVDNELTLTSEGFAQLTDDLEELFLNLGVQREDCETAFADIRTDLIDLFNQYANAEKQIDLFEPKERFSESLEDKPALKDVPKDTPLDKSWLDDYLQLIRKTDEPFEDKVKAFKKKWNKRSYFSHEL